MARREATGRAGGIMAGSAWKRASGLLKGMAGPLVALAMFGALSAGAQQVPNTGAPMVPNATGGSFPPTGCSTANGVIINNATPCSSAFTFTPSTSVLNLNGATYLTSPGNANWQFGNANVNGAPVAQTLSFQGALAGSATNQASASTTIIGSLGTGTGTNGDIIFQTGVKVGTGTAQATATTALTIKGETQQVQFAAGTTSNTSISFGDIGTGFYRPATNVIGFVTAGTQWWQLVSSGALQSVSGSVSGSAVNAGLRFANNASSGSRPSLIDEASNSLSLMSDTTTNAQSLRVYATLSSGGTNFQRAIIDAGKTTANVVTIGADNGGTGVAMNLAFVAAKTTGGGPTTVFDYGIANQNSLTAFVQLYAPVVNFSGWWTLTQSAGGGVNFGSGHGIAWGSASTNIQAGTISGDTTLCRSSAGVAEVGTTACNALGSLLLTNITASGANVLMTGLGASGVGATFVCLSTGNAIVTGATCAASDENAKENITAMAHGLDWVSRMEPISYVNGPQFGKLAGIASAGFSAQRMAAIDPVLAQWQDGKPWSINDRAILAVHTMSIQELKADNDNLRTEVEALKRSIRLGESK